MTQQNYNDCAVYRLRCEWVQLLNWWRSIFESQTIWITFNCLIPTNLWILKLRWLTVTFDFSTFMFQCMLSFYNKEHGERRPVSLKIKQTRGHSWVTVGVDNRETERNQKWFELPHYYTHLQDRRSGLTFKMCNDFMLRGGTWTHPVGSDFFFGNNLSRMVDVQKCVHTLKGKASFFHCRTLWCREMNKLILVHWFEWFHPVSTSLPVLSPPLTGAKRWNAAPTFEAQLPKLPYTVQDTSGQNDWVENQILCVRSALSL